MKIDQVAYYCSDFAVMKQILGLVNSEWIFDTVTATSYVRGEGPAINVAELQFNYDLGIELELIQYVKGPHWHAPIQRGKPFLSHVGIHLEDGEAFPAMTSCELVQETFTVRHTSHYLTKGAGAGRLYHYKIFQLSAGNYIKYIRRINPK